MPKSTSVFKRAYGFTAHTIKDMLNKTYYQVYKAHREGRLDKMLTDYWNEVRQDRIHTDSQNEEEENE